MNKIRIISVGIVVSILTIFFTIWLVTSDEISSIKQLLVIIGIAVVFAIFVIYDPFRKKL